MSYKNEEGVKNVWVSINFFEEFNQCWVHLINFEIKIKDLKMIFLFL